MNKKIAVLLASIILSGFAANAQRQLPKSQERILEKTGSSYASTKFRKKFLEDVVGTYQMSPVTNGYHNGEITVAERDDNGVPKTYIWKNKADISWHLYNRFGTLSLKTHETENPYFKNGERWFQFVFNEDGDGNLSPKPVGFIFNGELYAKQKNK